MRPRAVVYLLLTIFTFCSCSSGRHYSPAKKIPKNLLEKDYVLLRNILESKHPSLYWYTSKDSMDIYFNQYQKLISDSMTETQFTWKVLAPLINKIHCGHTSLIASKGYAAWSINKKISSFPLFFKIWKDTMAVSGNLNKNDSLFKRGTIITAINGQSSQQMISTIFDYLPQDGYANNLNYIRISSNFPFFHKNIYGLSEKYNVSYKDSTGMVQSAVVPLFKYSDTTRTKDTNIIHKNKFRISRKKKLENLRSLKIDSTKIFATMIVNTFQKGHLSSFFRRSFKKLRKNNINQLIVDIRSNGGGKVASSTLFTRYLSRQPFKVADSIYAVTCSLLPYTQYIKGRCLNSIGISLITKKEKDGKYHLRHLENKTFTPKRKNQFKGSVYVLTNGPTFSAASLFCNLIKGQPGIILAGEETGGGWHGNDGIFIPNITLPNTKIRVRLPLFRVIQYKHVPKTGTGVIPDLPIPPNYDALLRGVDKKMEVIKAMILSSEKK